MIDPLDTDDKTYCDKYEETIRVVKCHGKIFQINLNFKQAFKIPLDDKIENNYSTHWSKRFPKNQTNFYITFGVMS